MLSFNTATFLTYSEMTYAGFTYVLELTQNMSKNFNFNFFSFRRVNVENLFFLIKLYKIGSFCNIGHIN